MNSERREELDNKKAKDVNSYKTNYSASKAVDNLYLQTLALLSIYIKESKKSIFVRKDLRKKSNKGLDRYTFELDIRYDIRKYKEYLKVVIEFFEEEIPIETQRRSSNCNILSYIVFQNKKIDYEELLFKGRLLYLTISKEMEKNALYSLLLTPSYLNGIEML